MKVLILGYSQNVRERVLPALAGLGLDKVDIASASRAGSVQMPAGVGGKVYDDYAEAIKRSRAELVWVSTVSSTHAAWAAEALSRGRHAVVDKPAGVSLELVQRALELAQAKSLLLAEAQAWTYHPQVAAARQAIAEADSAPAHLLAAYSFPPLAETNFRYQRALGGGAINDLGPFAVSAGRIFFGAMPEEICCRVTAMGQEVDTAFSLMLTYPDGRSLTGHFGFDAGYVNHLRVLAPQAGARLERAFSPAAEQAALVETRHFAKQAKVEVAPADAFALFVRAVMQAVNSGQHQDLARDLLWDARALQRLRQAAAPAQG